MMNFKFLILLPLIIESVSTADFTEYLDLKIGNIFVYNCVDWRAVPPNYNCSGNYRMKIVITDTISYSGKKYYRYTRQLVLVSGTCTFGSFMFPFNVGNYYTIRIDSAEGMIYYYNPGNGCSYSPTETMIDSLNSNVNDVVTIRCVPSPYSYPCIDTTGKRKYYIGGGPHGTIRREYVRGVGLVNNYQYQLISGSQGSDEQTLIGRVVNGIVYGDTSMLTGISQISSQVPTEYSLSQNYPNPFNPMTKFGFRIAEFGLVRFTIFDALGKEVGVLVNQELQPGAYEIDFDGSDLPSGVYYYRLDASTSLSNTYTQTRKMVLIK